LSEVAGQRAWFRAIPREASQLDLHVPILHRFLPQLNRVTSDMQYTFVPELTAWVKLFKNVRITIFLFNVLLTVHRDVSVQ